MTKTALDIHSAGQQRQHGLTLIELMIALIVLSIVVTIAIPSYNKSLIRSQRSDAKVLLSQIAQRLERCYAECNAYNCTFSTVCPVALPQQSAAAYYEISAGNGTSIMQDSYTLVATPLPGNVQASDKQCTSLSLTDTGVRSATGTAPEICWR